MKLNLQQRKVFKLNYPLKFMRLMIFLCIIFLVFLQSAIAEDNLSIDNNCYEYCDKEFGLNNIDRFNVGLSKSIVNECRTFISPASYSIDYLGCVKDVSFENDACRESCKTYMTDPCYGECETNFNKCLNECNQNYNSGILTCENIFLDLCLDGCRSACSEKKQYYQSINEDQVLSCVNFACEFVPKGSMNKINTLACNRKKSGDVCGGKLACSGNSCRMVKSQLYGIPTQDQVSQCNGRNIGDNCCMKPELGDCKKIKRQEKTEYDTNRSLLKLECQWTAYDVWDCAKYNKETCNYDENDMSTIREYSSSGASHGFMGYLFCYHEDIYDPSTMRGGTSVKG